MTTGETEETQTCGEQKKAGGRTGGETSMKLSLSFTALSTIAIQAGQSQIVISVLKSGSVVHLQLVQVHPGLCEIGSNQEENQTLIREQQQLMEKLKKHEREVLAVVEKSRQTEQRKKRDEGVMKQKRNKKQEEEELYEAMLASLREGWLLLLRLLERRQEVLTLASEFYRRTLEFAISIDRVEDLQVRRDNDRLTEVQLAYESMRRDLLGKSLQVLTSSSVLLQKLRQLQRTEALQRRGGVLHDEEAVEEESSQCSKGMALRLEALVETLQDRRRRADQAFRLQLQQMENDIMVHEEEDESRQAEDWILTINEIQNQNLESGSTSGEGTDLKSDSRTKETRELQSESKSEETRDLQSGIKLNLKAGSVSDLKTDSKSEVTRNLQRAPRLDQTSGTRADMQPEDLKTPFKSDETRSTFTLNLKAGSRSDLETDSKSAETRYLLPGSRLDQTPRSTSEVHPGSGLDQKCPFESEKTKNMQSAFKLNLGSRSHFKIASNSEDTRELEPGFRSLDQTPTDVQPGFGSDIKTESRSEKTKNVDLGSSSDVLPGSRLDVKSPFKSEDTRKQQSGSKTDVTCESRPQLKPGCRPAETINLQSRFKLNFKSTSDLQLSTSEDLPPGSRLDQMPGSRSGLHPGFSLEEKPESRSEQTTDLDSGSKSQDTRNLESGTTSPESTDLRPDSRTKEARDLQPGSRQEESINLESGSRAELKSDSKSEESRDLQPGSRLGVQPASRLNLKSPFKSDETRNLQSGSRPEEIMNLQSGFKLNFKSTSDLQMSTSEDLPPGSRSGLLPGFSLEEEPESRSEQTTDLDSGSKSQDTRNLESGTTSPESTDLRPDSRTKEARDLQPGSRQEESINLESGSRAELKSDSKSEESRDLQPGSRLGVQPASRLKLKSPFKSDETRNLQSGSRPEEIMNLQSGFKLKSRSDIKFAFKSSEAPKDLPPGSRSDVQSGIRLEQVSESKSDIQSGFGLEVKPESRSEQTRDVYPGCRSEEARNLEFRLKEAKDLQPESRSEETINLQSGLKLNLRAGSTSDLKTNSKSEESTDLQPGSRSDIYPQSRLDLKSPFKSEETKHQQSGSTSVESTDQKPDSITKETRDQQPGSRQEETRNLQPGFKLNLKVVSRLDLKADSKSESRDLRPGSRLDQTLGSRSVVQTESTSDLESPFKSNETLNQEPGSGSDVKREFKPELEPGSRSEQTTDLCTKSRSQETINVHLRPRSEESIQLHPGSGSEKTTDNRPETGSVVKPESRSKTCSLSCYTLVTTSKDEQAEDLNVSEPNRRHEASKQHRAATTNTSSGQPARPESMLGNESQSREDHDHQVLLANKRQQLLMSCEHLMDKICSWVQQGSSVLSNSSEAGQRLSEAEDTLNTHLQLHTQAEPAGQDAEQLKQILDQIRALHTDSISRTSPQPPSEASRHLSPLQALTEQLKRGSTGRQTRTSAAQPSPPAPTCSVSPELAGRVDLVLKELWTLNRKIDSNLQLLQPYVTFLRMVQQVEEEMEELRDFYIRSSEEEERQEEKEAGSDSNIRTSSPAKKQDDASWLETLQRLLTAQELGNKYLCTVPTVMGAGLNLQSMLSLVQQRVEGLSRTKQEVNKLQSQQQIQIQQQQEYCRKYHEKMLKIVQDLNCVSELLDSCTLMDLGSDLLTSRLLERFSQAGPHFNKLGAEVESLKKSWETLRGVQNRLHGKELKGEAVKEEDLSNVLKLQKSMKNKIQQSESILDLTSRFHLTSRQLDALLLSDLGNPVAGSTGLSGSSEAELSRLREEQQQVHRLLKTASTLKTDICTAIDHSGWTCFRVEQLEARLLSLDSLCVSWLNEAGRQEEKLRRELLTCRLNDDINQLRDSFKELKKRFSNLKFNYLKRNDRTRNMKAVRNQLQQVELYEEKLQVLRKRLQGVTARLGSEVKNGGVAREAEDAINELQRQMGDFERSVNDHQKTLEMTRRLQQAMEEYQFWCEEASATIARVGKFSSECRSTEAVAVLYQQFEKFVWPTVPEQEERISQISELAVRLHGVEEGRRYIEKTVSKHSEMVESIRELSDGLMELEAKLKMEDLKKQQNDAEKVIKEVGEPKRRRENDAEEKDEVKEKLKEKRKKEQTDNRSSQEANDMYELKETGHTPELTAEQDWKEAPVKRQTAASRKPPLQKSRSQEADRPTAVSENSHRQQLNNERRSSSYCSTHTFSLSCSPVETRRRIHAIHSQLQHQATPPPSMIGPLFSDIQREFQRKEVQELGQQGVYVCESNGTPPQDVSAGGLSEAELQQQEAMTEDSLSNDEYECVSPDDISLPPLAETPESNMIQSDIEEGFCFSSHSTHINQYSHHSGSSAGAVQQQRESSQTESCPTPPTGLHSNTRFRSDSNSFVQSPLTVPPPILITRTLCSILRTCETTTENVSQSADLSLDSPDLNFTPGSKPVQKNNTSDSCSDKENNVSDKRGSPQNDLLLKKCNSQSVLTTIPQDNNPLRAYPDSRSALDQQVSSLQTSESSSSLNTASTFTEKHINCQSFPPDSHCNVPQNSSNLRSQQRSPSHQGNEGLPEHHEPVPPEPNSLSNNISKFSITSSNRFSSKQSHQTMYSLHKSLTSTCTQQCVHDPGMTSCSPAKPTASLQPESQTQALAHQANLHVLSSPRHLLTSDQDPNICQPMAIREEIRLTPQIKGPPLPAPPTLPQAQSESVPQGKASKPGPPSFTRPLSRATLMEGSPVTLEVEVTGHPEPTLSWFQDGEASDTGLGQSLACEDRNHFLLVPEASDSDGGLHGTRAANHHYVQHEAANSCSSGDKWLVAEAFDIVSLDLQSWFGTLCVLLWLLCLIVL